MSCYRAGIEYTHGGLSLQECVVLKMIVQASSAQKMSGVAISEVTWKGLRCRVAIAGASAGLRLDVRTHAGNAATSVATKDRPFKEDGTASVVVEDDTLSDHEATIVVVDAQGHLIAQQNTVIGKD